MKDEKYLHWLARFTLAMLILWVVWVAVALAVDTDAKNPKYFYRITLNGRYLNGDSSDVLVAYPADEDTAGNRISCTWLGGSYNVWQFAPDSSDVYDFYGRASTGADTLISYMTDRLVLGVTASEGFVNSSRAFAVGVVDSAALGTDAALKNLVAGSVGGAAADLRGTAGGLGAIPAKFDNAEIEDSLYVGSGGDTTTTHRVETGFFRYVQGIVTLTYSAGLTTETHDFPGATADMVFIAWMPTSAATADQFSAAYASAGKINVVAQNTAVGSRAITVIGFKK